MFEPNPLRRIDTELRVVAYYPQIVRNQVGQQITVYAAVGTPTNQAEPLSGYHAAAIECYGAEFFEEWHPVTFARAGARGLHRGLINDSHTQFAIEHHRIRGTDFARPLEDLVVTLGSEHVRFRVTPRWTNGGNGISGMAIFDLQQESPWGIPNLVVKNKTYRDHPDYADFIAAICHTPADDMPRLAFADWLDERGEVEASSRADYIRTVIGGDDNEICRMMARSTTWETWASEPERQFPGCKFAWSRGFVSEIRCTLAQFERHAAAISKTHPVEKWVLTDREPLVSQATQHHPRFYTYVTQYRISHPANLPSEFGIPGEGQWHRFETIELANEWLQDRCYVVARRRAGIESTQEV